VVPHEIRSLVGFDHKVFPEADWFEPDDWREYKSFWMQLNGRRVGCCAFGEHEDFRDDIGPDNIPRKGTLYIASTGIIPEFQGVGLGRPMKAWQVSCALSQLQAHCHELPEEQRRDDWLEQRVRFPRDSDYAALL
jgi:GNAT superfamily N-acetyltransferase